MKRRSFLGFLASLPFVGKAAAEVLKAPKQPDWYRNYVQICEGLIGERRRMQNTVQYHGEQFELPYTLVPDSETIKVGGRRLIRGVDYRMEGNRVIFLK